MRLLRKKLILALCLLLCVPVAGWADYVAYSVDDGRRVPLPENIDGIEAKYLLNLEWGEFAGRRARLGVLPVDNTSTASSFQITSGSGSVNYSSSNAGVPVNGIEAIVTDVLARTGRFRLLERTQLGSVLGEQDLVTGGRVSEPSGAATGKVLGAEYLVQVVITDYQPNVKGRDFGVGGLLGKKVPVLGGVKVESSEGRVGLNFRLVDAETSEVVFTKQVDSVIRESGLTFGGAGGGSDLVLGGFMDSYSRTPIGQAVIAGINKGAFELVKEIGVRPAEGSVVKADGDRIWLNLGREAVSVGDTLIVLEKGEELIDPETGLSLGGSVSELGEIEVTEVQEKYSVARPVSLTKTPGRGDRVKGTTTPAPMKFGSGWNRPK